MSRFNIRPNADIHGDEGPVSVAYPRYIYNQSGMISLKVLLHANVNWWVKLMKS